MKEKKTETNNNNNIKRLEVASLVFEPAPHLPPARKVRAQTPGPCDGCTLCLKINSVEGIFLCHSHCLNLVELYLS